MTAVDPGIPGQEEAPFSLTMEVEEDIEQEIESFVRFKRRGEYERAEELFQQTLSAHLPLFPVIAEYADLLMVQEKYRILSEFLDIQLQYMQSLLEEEEVELLLVMRSLAYIYTQGSLRSALTRAKKTWDFLRSRRTKLVIGALPSDVEIHIFELYIRIIIFALKTSDWVGLDDMRCPWVQDQRSDHCGFVEWYLNLSCNDQVWSASQVLIVLLQALPQLRRSDAAVLFDKECFGEMPNKDALRNLCEKDQLVAFSTSFSRAHALLDLSLVLQRSDFYAATGRKLFEVACRYQHVSEFLSKILFRHGMVGIPGLRADIQKKQFARVKEFVINETPPKSFSSHKFDISMRSLAQQDPHCYIICYFQSFLSPVKQLSDPHEISTNFTSLFDTQLQDQGNLIGFIRICDLCITLMHNFNFGAGLSPKSEISALSSAADSFLPGRLLRRTAEFKELKGSLQSVLDQLAEKITGLEIPSYNFAMSRIVKTLYGKSLARLGLSKIFNGNLAISYLPEPVSPTSISVLADLLLEMERKKTGFEEYGSHLRQIDTCTRDSSSDLPIAKRVLEQDIKECGEVEFTGEHTSKESSIRSISLSEQILGEPVAGPRKPVKLLLKGKDPINYHCGTAASEAVPPMNSESPSSYRKLHSYRSVGILDYQNICMELREAFMRSLKRPESQTYRFVPRGTAQEVLRAERLHPFFYSLRLPVVAIQALSCPYEESLARQLHEKDLYDFLAILICSWCDIEAVKKFVVKLLVLESWRAERCFLPTSREILSELFEDESTPDQFLVYQAIFCPAVIVAGREVEVSSLGSQRFPYLEEEKLCQGAFGSVSKVVIAEGHIRHGNHLSKDPSFHANRRPIEIARKDYIMNGDWTSRRPPADRYITETILSIGKKSDNILENIGAFSIGNMDYSLFMPLAACDLKQYMMIDFPMRPFSISRRVDIIRNVHGLADGLDYLHNRLRTRSGDKLVCYGFHLRPEKVLIFWKKTPQGERPIWKISDFGMSYVKYRRQDDVVDTLIDFKSRFARRLEPTPQGSRTSRTSNQRSKGTCLAPESMASPLIMSPSDDIWSLGCVISIVFAYLDEGAIGVKKYSEKRARHTRADKCDRFFIRGKGKLGPPMPHPVMYEWHTRLIKNARRRSRLEGKAVEVFLRFLETKVFQEQAARCDALAVERKLFNAWVMYEEEDDHADEGRQSSLERFLLGPLVRRVVSRINPQEILWEYQEDNKSNDPEDYKKNGPKDYKNNDPKNYTFQRSTMRSGSKMGPTGMD